MCLRYARDAQEAEDFLHDGMLKVLQDIGQFRGQGALGGWVRRVVLNVALQQLRRRPTMVSETAVPEQATEAEELELEQGMQSLSGAQIFALLARLPVGYRTVFNLYYVEQQGHKEISAALGISEGASKSQLYKARLALRRVIKEQYPTYQYRS